MFEKEIKFLYDLTLTKMKPLGNSFYLSQLQDVGVHPAIIHYISCELDYLIYEDRQKLLKNSTFDYYGEKIDAYFELIADEIKKNKKFQFNLLQKYILTSVAFNVNYVCNTHQTLIKFLFNNQEEKKLKEISLLLNYLFYNDYYKKIILTYLNKKKYITVNKQETSELIKKIDKINLETNSISIIQQALTSISDFFNYGKSYKNNVPVSSIETWFFDKDLSKSYNQLSKLIKLDGKSVVTIQEVIKVVNEKDIFNSEYIVDLVDLSEKSELEKEEEIISNTNLEVILEYEDSELENQNEQSEIFSNENILEVKLDESLDETIVEFPEATEKENGSMIRDDEKNYEEQEVIVQDKEITIEEINKSKELNLSDLLADFPELDSSTLINTTLENSQKNEINDLIEKINDESSYNEDIQQLFPVEDEILENISQDELIQQNIELNEDELKPFDVPNPKEDNIPYEKKIKILDLSSKDEKPDYYISEKKNNELDISTHIEDNFIFNEAEIQKEFESMQNTLIDSSIEDLESISEKNKQLISELEKELANEFDDSSTDSLFIPENDDLPNEASELLNIDLNPDEEIVDLENINTNSFKEKENINTLDKIVLKIEEDEIDFESIEDKEHLIVTNFINENNLINQNKEININELESDFEVYEKDPVPEINNKQDDLINQVIESHNTQIKIEEEIDFEKLENIGLTDPNIQKVNDSEIDFEMLQEEILLNVNKTENEDSNIKNIDEFNFKDIEEEIDLEKNIKIFEEELIKEESQIETTLDKTKDFKIEIDMIDLLEHRKIPEIIEVMFDYDMEEFTNLIESVQLSEDYANAEVVIDKFCASHHVRRDSKETILFKDLIKKYFKEG